MAAPVSWPVVLNPAFPPARVLTGRSPQEPLPGRVHTSEIGCHVSLLLAMGWAHTLSCGPY
eukprot:2508789-Heterocapsa_arctica.AAC.1